MAGISSIFGSSGDQKSPVNPQNEEIKKQLQTQISQELAVANATELVNKVTENCYAKCVPEPGVSLSSAEEECTKKCLQKYMHAWNTVSRHYISRIQQQGQK